MLCKIYKIVCNKTGMIYIGSTTKTLQQRLYNHKKDYKKYLDGKYHYVTSYKIIENNDFYIELIEEFEYISKKDIFEKEGAYIRGTDCINERIPNRTKKEYMEKYRSDNKDKLKKYLDDNKYKIKEYKKKYHLENKEKFREYHKKYYLYKTEITRLMNIDF